MYYRSGGHKKNQEDEDEYSPEKVIVINSISKKDDSETKINNEKSKGNAASKAR